MIKFKEIWFLSGESNVKKFLFILGGLFILLGTGGLINFISMTLKAIQEEQEMYGGSVYFMFIQSVGTASPYLLLLIGGGIIISIATFLTEYKKRSDLTSKLIDVLAQQQIQSHHVNSRNESAISKEPTIDSPSDEFSEYEDFPQSEKNTEERIYWKG